MGQAIADISRDTEVAETMSEILETQRMVDGESDITLVRMTDHTMLSGLLASDAMTRMNATVNNLKDFKSPGKDAGAFAFQPMDLSQALGITSGNFHLLICS